MEFESTRKVMQFPFSYLFVHLFILDDIGIFFLCISYKIYLNRFKLVVNYKNLQPPAQQSKTVYYGVKLDATEPNCNGDRNPVCITDRSILLY